MSKIIVMTDDPILGAVAAAMLSSAGLPVEGIAMGDLSTLGLPADTAGEDPAAATSEENSPEDDELTEEDLEGLPPELAAVLRGFLA